MDTDRIDALFRPRRSEPSPIDAANVRILTGAQAELQEISRVHGWQAMLDAANRLIDTSAGIVAGDGCYRPRRGFPG